MKRIVICIFLTMSAYLCAQMPELTPQSGHPAAVSAYISEAGSPRIFTGDKIGNVICWNIESGRQLRSYRGLNEEIIKLTHSKSGRYIAALGKKGEVKIWESKTGALAGEHRAGVLGEYIDIQFGREEEYLFMATDRGSFFKRHIADYGDSKGISSVLFTDSISTKIYTESVYSVKDSCWFSLMKDRFTYYLKINSFDRTERVFTFTANQPKSLRISSNGLYFGFVAAGEISIFDPVSGSPYTKIETGIDTLESFMFSTDGMRVITSAGDGVLGIYHQLTGRKYASIKTEKGDFITSDLTDNRVVAYGSGKPSVFDITGRKKITTFSGNVRYMSAFEFYGKENNLAAGSLVEGMSIIKGDGKTVTLPVKKGGIRLTKVSPDNKVIAVADEDYLALFDAETGEKLYAIDTTIGNLQCMSFSPDGNTLLIGLMDASILLFNTESKLFKKTGGFNGEVFAIDYHPDGKEIAVVDVLSKVSIINAETMEKVRDAGKHPSILYDAEFSPDGKHLVSAVQDSGIYIWDYRADTLVVRLQEFYGLIFQTEFSADGKLLAAGAVGGAVYVYRTSDWKKIHEFDNPGSYLGIISFSGDGKYVAGIAATGQLRIWSTVTGKEYFTYTAFNNNDWAITLPDGRFDASQEGMKLLHFVKGYDVFPLESFFNENYTPGLAGDLLAGKITEPDSAEIAEKFLFKLPPDAAIVSPKATSKLKAGKNLVDISATDKGGGIKWIRLYLNDKLIEERDYTGRPVKEGETITFTVTAELLAETNKLTVTASSLNGIESLPITVFVDAQGTKPKSRLYIAGIGINNYKNPAYTLSLAENDIKTLRDKIIRGTENMVSGVEEYIFLSEEAVRGNIIAAFDSIAAKAKASDIFILLYSGHGVFQSGEKGEGDFYFVLHDMLNMYSADTAVLGKGISAKELRGYSKKIAANKQLLIIDACQAGGAVETFALRGAEEEKAIQSLARSSGMFLLASSAKNSGAKELPALGMGLYSYALSEALNCFGDYDKDGILSVKEMEFFARNKLEEVQKKYKLAPQYPMSWMMYQDFPIRICK